MLWWQVMCVAPERCQKRSACGYAVAFKRRHAHIAQVTTTHSRHGAAARLCTNPDRLISFALPTVKLQGMSAGLPGGAAES